MVWQILNLNNISMLNLLKRNGIADLTRAQVQILPLYSAYCRSPSFVPFHDVFAPTLEICHVIYAHAQTPSLSPLRRARACFVFRGGLSSASVLQKWGTIDTMLWGKRVTPRGYSANRSKVSPTYLSRISILMGLCQRVTNICLKGTG